MRNILFVSTGGTIGSMVTCSTVTGSTATGATIDTDPKAGLLLMSLLQSHYRHFDQCAFAHLQPLRLLSENLTPAVWTQIIDAVHSQPLAGLDGIIISHGTDTLNFTAAALGLYWHGLELPVLLVASDHPLTDGRANGLDNAICALEFIRQRQGTGVFVPYRNPGQAMRVHQGTRLSACLPLTGDFIGVGQHTPLGFDGQHFSAPPGHTAARPARAFALKPDFSRRILLIRPYPGLDYRCFNLEQVEVVLHDLYHSGTAAADVGEHQALPAFIGRCARQGIPVYLAPARDTGPLYQSTRTLLAHGARMVWNMSLEAAYAKLLLAYGNFADPEAIAAFLATDLAGEHIG